MLFCLFFVSLEMSLFSFFENNVSFLYGGYGMSNVFFPDGAQLLVYLVTTGWVLASAFYVTIRPINRKNSNNSLAVTTSVKNITGYCFEYY